MAEKEKKAAAGEKPKPPKSKILLDNSYLLCYNFVVKETFVMLRENANRPCYTAETDARFGKRLSAYRLRGAKVAGLSVRLRASAADDINQISVLAGGNPK